MSCFHSVLYNYLLPRVLVMNSDPVPEGCTMTTVGASCEVHLMLRGLVDVGKEISKLQEKISKIDTISKLNKSMSIEDYERRVSSLIFVGIKTPPGHFLWVQKHWLVRNFRVYFFYATSRGTGLRVSNLKKNHFCRFKF